MKISKVNLPEESVGLKAVNIEKLGQVVLITGKNGSGKTRLFNSLKDKLKKHPNNDQIQRLEENIRTAQKLIDSYESEIASIEVGSSLKNRIPILQKQIQQQQLQIDNHKKSICLGKQITIQDRLYGKVFLDFVPKFIEMTSPHSVNKNQINDAYSQYQKIHEFNFEQQYRSSPALLYISKIQEKYVALTHPSQEFPQEEVDKITKEYESLKKLIKQVLNTDLQLTREGPGDFALFGLTHDNMNLSDGQKILLQLCVDIHAKGENIENLIVFMDEPENHLHPAALLYVVDQIKNVVKNGQIWISTHSINLIAHLNDASLFYMENGKIEYAGNSPEKVLEGLLGDEEERLRLSDFITMPYKYAELKFAYECLLKAPAIMTGQADVQTQQVRENLEKLISTGNQVRILDFGAGRGRLIANILAYENDKGKDIQWLDYIAFEPTGDYAQECRQHIQVAYGSAEKRHFTNLPDLKSQLDKESFDIIVMLNVFHEIDPSYWVRFFEEDGELYQLLKPDGYLLIVEHQILTYGETAHSKGFLMFDQLEFKTLFSISERDMADKKYFVDSKRDGELKAHFIQKDLLANISITSKENALKSLKDHSIDEITRLKTQEPSLKNGRHLAFWNQQLANAFMALRGS